MTGSLTVVGIGPGSLSLLTPAARDALASASDLIGYAAYLDRIAALTAGKHVHESGNGVELDRARHALQLAATGSQVAVVSGGDPGVFAMAAAVFEAIDAGDPAWRTIDVRVEPGVSALLAAAAEIGAPLGGDFCAISLSDNLKSWATIERRLKAAADGDFVIALYNPASRARPHQLGDAFRLLSGLKPPATVVAFVSAAGTAAAACRLTTLAKADAAVADMRTLVFIGANATRLIGRDGKPSWVYTPRSEEAPSR